MGGNLVSYTLLLNLLYVAVFLFPITIMSWSARKKDLPTAVFMLTMAIMSIIVCFKIQSYYDCIVCLVFIAIIIIMNGIGWLIFGRKNKHDDD